LLFFLIDLEPEVFHPWKAVNVVHVFLCCFVVTRNSSIDSFVSD